MATSHSHLPSDVASLHAIILEQLAITDHTPVQITREILKGRKFNPCNDEFGVVKYINISIV